MLGAICFAFAEGGKVHQAGGQIVLFAVHGQMENQQTKGLVLFFNGIQGGQRFFFAGQRLHVALETVMLHPFPVRGGNRFQIFCQLFRLHGLKQVILCA